MEDKIEKVKHRHFCYECGESWYHYGLGVSEYSKSHPINKKCIDCREHSYNYRDEFGHDLGLIL